MFAFNNFLLTFDNFLLTFDNFLLTFDNLLSGGPGLLLVTFYRYKTQNISADKKKTQTLFLLMDLMQFFDLYHEGKLDIALDVSLLELCWTLILSHGVVEGCDAMSCSFCR